MHRGAHDVDPTRSREVAVRAGRAAEDCEDRRGETKPLVAKCMHARRSANAIRSGI